MRGFDDRERERLREQLVEAGRQHLLEYGPEKTTVADVTEPAGIAKSTFYQFFDSKAELYLEIFVREQDDFLQRLHDRLDGVEDAETGLRRLFEVYLGWVEESPLLQVLLDPADPRSAVRGVPAERLERHEQEALAEMLPYLQAWQASGELRDVEPELVLGCMGALAFSALHREEFEAYDEGMYEAVRDLLVDAIARGLTDT